MVSNDRLIARSSNALNARSSIVGDL